MATSRSDSPPPKTTNEQPDQEKKPTVWHHQQVAILKEWGEKAGGYRWMHERAAARYKKMHVRFSLPVIILSTLAGTANFAQSSFTGEMAEWAPSIIGGVNLLAGMITTVAQFLKIGELMEGHRMASIQFGKFSRSIAVELSLPPSDRTMNGDEFLEKMRMEFDTLLEQSPPVPVDLGQLYLKTIKKLEKDNPGSPKISLPEILEVKGLTTYMPTVEERAADITQHAAGKLLEKGLMGKLRKAESDAKDVINKAKTFAPAAAAVAGAAATAQARKEETARELASLTTGRVRAMTKIPSGTGVEMRDIMGSQNVPESLKMAADIGGKANKMASILRRSEPNLYASTSAMPQGENLTEMMGGLAGDIISSKIEEGMENVMGDLESQAGSFLQNIATAGSNRGDSRKE